MVVTREVKEEMIARIIGDRAGCVTSRLMQKFLTVDLFKKIKRICTQRRGLEGLIAKSSYSEDACKSRKHLSKHSRDLSTSPLVT